MEELEQTAKQMRTNADLLEGLCQDRLATLFQDKRKARKAYQEEHSKIMAQFNNVSAPSIIIMMIILGRLGWVAYALPAGRHPGWGVWLVMVVNRYYSSCCCCCGCGSLAIHLIDGFRDRKEEFRVFYFMGRKKWNGFLDRLPLIKRRDC